MYFKKLMNFTGNIVLYNHFRNVYRSLKVFFKMVIDHEKCYKNFIYILCVCVCVCWRERERERVTLLNARAG